MANREWKTIEGFDFKEILFEEYNHIAKITINRPRYRNAFTPLTVWEISQAFSYCREAFKHTCSATYWCGRQSILRRWRYECERSWRLCRWRRSTPSECVRCANANPPLTQASHCYGKRLRNRWRTRAPRYVRPKHCIRKCNLWADWSEGRFVRCRLRSIVSLHA